MAKPHSAKPKEKRQVVCPQNSAEEPKARIKCACKTDTQNHGHEPSGRLVASLLIAILMLASIMRTYAICGKGLVGTDEAAYLMAGRNLWRGAGFCDSPGDPLTIHPGLHGVVVGGLARLLGLTDLQKANGICYVFFGAAGTLAIFLLARRLFDNLTGLLSAALFAVLPAVAVQTYYWDSTVEPLTLLLLVIGCLGFWWSYTTKAPLGAILGAGSFGLASCVRNDGFVFMLVMSILLFGGSLIYRTWPLKKTAIYLFAALLAFAVVYSPYGRFLMKHTGRLTTSVGLHTLKNYDPMRLEQDWFYHEKPGSIGDDQTIPQYISRHWGDWLAGCGKNLRVMLLQAPTELIPFYLLPFVGLALFGEPQRERRSAKLFLATMALPVLVYALFYVQMRFLVIAIPAIVILVGYGLSLVQLRSQSLRLTVWLVIVALVAFHSMAKVPSLRQGTNHPEFKAVGAWIAAHSESSDRIMLRKPQVAFYADRPSVSLPWVENEEELRQAALGAGAKYVVFDEALSLPYRPQLANLLDRTHIETSDLFRVVYADWKEGYKIVVLEPHKAAGPTFPR